MTSTQARVALAVYAATKRGEWYRAESSGERVTLASLHKHGWVTRRARRGAEGEADAAYEYQSTQVLAAGIEQAANDIRGVQDEMWLDALAREQEKK